MTNLLGGIKFRITPALAVVFLTALVSVVTQFVAQNPEYTAEAGIITAALGAGISYEKSQEQTTSTTAA